MFLHIPGQALMCAWQPSGAAANQAQGRLFCSAMALALRQGPEMAEGHTQVVQAASRQIYFFAS